MPALTLPDGVSLHYEIDGNGPPLMLIAGTASDSASWGPLVEPLSRRFTVIRPDNRSTGLGPHFGERPVAVVVIQLARILAILTRLVADEEIQPSVVVVVGPGSRLRRMS